METTSPTICESCGKVCTNLKEITDPSSSSQEVKLKHLQSESQPAANTTHSCMCKFAAASSSLAVDNEDIKNVVHEVLNSVINQIAECEDSHLREKIAKSEATPMLVQDSLVCRDMHSVSPVSEDSGIGCSLGHADEGKTEDSELADNSVRSHDNQLNDSAVMQASGDRVEHDETRSAQAQAEHSEESEMNIVRELDHPQSASLFAAFSSNVKYWLGQGNYGKNGNALHSSSLSF